MGENSSIKIGELLVRAGVVTGVDLSEAEQLAKRMQVQFGRILITSGCLTEHDLECALEAQKMIRNDQIPLDVACDALALASREQMPFSLALESITSAYGESASLALAELLADANILSPEQLGTALDTCMNENVPLGQLLVAENAISPSLLPLMEVQLQQIYDGELDRESALQEIRKNYDVWARAEASRRSGSHVQLMKPAADTPPPPPEPTPSERYYQEQLLSGQHAVPAAPYQQPAQPSPDDGYRIPSAPNYQSGEFPSPYAQQAQSGAHGNHFQPGQSGGYSNPYDQQSQSNQYGYPPQQHPGQPQSQPGGYGAPYGGGYPEQQGYPPQQPGYPQNQQGGYMQQPGYAPQQPGYQQQGYQQQQPAYPPQQSYPQQMPPGYPPQAHQQQMPPGYPQPQTGYPAAPGYPAQQSPLSGYSDPDAQIFAQQFAAILQQNVYGNQPSAYNDQPSAYSDQPQLAPNTAPPSGMPNQQPVSIDDILSAYRNPAPVTANPGMAQDVLSVDSHTNMPAATALTPTGALQPQQLPVSTQAMINATQAEPISAVQATAIDAPAIASPPVTSNLPDHAAPPAAAAPVAEEPAGWLQALFAAEASKAPTNLHNEDAPPPHTMPTHNEDRTSGTWKTFDAAALPARPASFGRTGREKNLSPLSNYGPNQEPPQAASQIAPAQSIRHDATPEPAVTDQPAFASGHAATPEHSLAARPPFVSEHSATPDQTVTPQQPPLVNEHFATPDQTVAPQQPPFVNEHSATPDHSVAPQQPPFATGHVANPDIAVAPQQPSFVNEHSATPDQTVTPQPPFVNEHSATPDRAVASEPAFITEPAAAAPEMPEQQQVGHQPLQDSEEASVEPTQEPLEHLLESSTVPEEPTILESYPPIDANLPEDSNGSAQPNSQELAHRNEQDSANIDLNSPLAGAPISQTSPAAADPHDAPMSPEPADSTASGSLFYRPAFLSEATSEDLEVRHNPLANTNAINSWTGQPATDTSAEQAVEAVLEPSTPVLDRSQASPDTSITAVELPHLESTQASEDFDDANWQRFETAQAKPKQKHSEPKLPNMHFSPILQLLESVGIFTNTEFSLAIIDVVADESRAIELLRLLRLATPDLADAASVCSQALKEGRITPDQARVALDAVNAGSSVRDAFTEVGAVYEDLFTRQRRAKQWRTPRRPTEQRKTTAAKAPSTVIPIPDSDDSPLLDHALHLGDSQLSPGPLTLDDFEDNTAHISTLQIAAKQRTAETAAMQQQSETAAMQPADSGEQPGSIELHMQLSELQPIADAQSDERSQTENTDFTPPESTESAQTPDYDIASQTGEIEAAQIEEAHPEPHWQPLPEEVAPSAPESTVEAPANSQSQRSAPSVVARIMATWRNQQANSGQLKSPDEPKSTSQSAKAEKPAHSQAPQPSTTTQHDEPDQLAAMSENQTAAGSATDQTPHQTGGDQETTLQLDQQPQPVQVVPSADPYAFLQELDPSLECTMQLEITRTTITPSERHKEYEKLADEPALQALIDQNEETQETTLKLDRHALEEHQSSAALDIKDLLQQDGNASDKAEPATPAESKSSTLPSQEEHSKPPQRGTSFFERMKERMQNLRPHSLVVKDKHAERSGAAEQPPAQTHKHPTSEPAHREHESEAPAAAVPADDGMAIDPAISNEPALQSAARRAEESMHSEELAQQAHSDSETDSDASAQQAPSDSETDSDASAQQAPSDSETDSDAPVQQAPSDSETDSDASAQQAPSDSETDSDAPVQQAPSDSETDSDASAQQAPSDSETDSDASAQQAPSDSETDSDASAQQAPSDSETDSDASAQQAPSDSETDSDASAQQAPSDSETDSDASAQQAPSDSETAVRAERESDDSSTSSTEEQDFRTAPGEGFDTIATGEHEPFTTTGEEEVFVATGESETFTATGEHPVITEDGKTVRKPSKRSSKNRRSKRKR